MTVTTKALPNHPITELVVDARGSRICADAPSQPGSPPIGLGNTASEALGDWLRQNAADLGITITLNAQALRLQKKLQAIPAEKTKSEPMSERARALLDVVDSRMLVTRGLVEDLLPAIGDHTATFSVTKSGARLVSISFPDGSSLLYEFGSW